MSFTITGINALEKKLKTLGPWLANQAVLRGSSRIWGLRFAATPATLHWLG